MKLKRIVWVVLLLAAVCVHLDIVAEGWLVNVLISLSAVAVVVWVLLTDDNLGLEHLFLIPVLYIGLEPLVTDYTTSAYTDEVKLLSWKFSQDEYGTGTVELKLRNDGDRDISFMNYVVRITAESSDSELIESGIVTDLYAESNKKETFLILEPEFEPDDIDFEIESINFK